jgi:hypothetical protein
LEGRFRTAFFINYEKETMLKKSKDLQKADHCQMRKNDLSYGYNGQIQWREILYAM